MSIETKKDSLTVAIVRLFTTSHLSLLFLIISLLAGAAALMLTAREEDPQIIVPVMDVFVQVPGASAEEVEKQVTTPLETLLRQIQGVEYVYSASRPGEAVVTVRYLVGENLENSLIKTRDKVLANQDIIPPGVTNWLVKPVEIDDVPILMLSLSPQQATTARDGGSADAGREPAPPQNSNIEATDLRRVADELVERLREVENVGKSWVVGSAPRRISVYPDPAKLQAGNITLLDIQQALAKNNVNLPVGTLTGQNKEIILEAGPNYQTAEQIGGTVVKVVDGRLLTLRDVAKIIDGGADTDTYTRIGFGPAVAHMQTAGEAGKLPSVGEERPLTTIAIAKRKGSNAVSVAEEVLKVTEQLKGTLIPDDVLITITRNYGETADHKVNELVMHLSIAILTIIVLLALSLGFKESLIVSLAVPMTFAVTLLCDYLFGYTINRVTLFALILSLGLLVDDPIVDVENIHRHYKMRKEPPLQALLSAVDEIRPPTILATFAVIMSFVPMFFITGMMGPYMAPMAFNVPVAMLMSLVIAFTVTPWASFKLLKGDYGKDHGAEFNLKETRGFKIYQAIVAPLLASKAKAWLFLLVVIIAFVASAMMAVTRVVPLKLLPFDNKNELQLIIDMPKGSSLETTDEVSAALGHYLATVNEVSSYQSYVGLLSSPMDFNGMVRHYYLRQGANVGDIRIVLADKKHRDQPSHNIALRIRPEVERIGKQYGANIKIVEMPPGPPVLSTLVAEVYGPPEASYADLIHVAKRVRGDIEKTAGVVDVDDFAEAEHGKLHYLVDHDKAALLGISTAQVAQTLQLAIAGGSVGVLHIPQERQPLTIQLQLPRAARSSEADLLALSVQTSNGQLVRLSEIGSFKHEQGERAIYHKNLQRVAYVTGEMAGRSPVEAILDLFGTFDDKPLPDGYKAEMAGEGEWKITVDVFRDLGIAFGAAMVMIYVLLVGQTGSLGVPLIMMIAIPLTVIGIMPGFWFINLFTEPVGGYATPIYFTATAMIGMIALAGIVVRNSIILIDFIENIYRNNPVISLADAIVEAGATRLNPIFLTAASAVLGSMMIVLDPIFSGLAWSFIFGIIASTLFSLVVIPVVYFLIKRNMPKQIIQEQ